MAIRYQVNLSLSPEQWEEYQAVKGKSIVNDTDIKISNIGIFMQGVKSYSKLLNIAKGE